MSVTAGEIKRLAADCGFELAGVAAAEPHGDYRRFDQWRRAGMAGEMQYLTDRRGDVRSDPKHLLASARSLICVGKLYHTDQPLSTEVKRPDRGWISRYAWGQDYHQVLHAGLARLVEKLTARTAEPFDWKICVDTAPLLERSYARMAGLGWIGKNTCLINQQSGSWFVLGEVLVSLALDADTPPADRCGTCRRCIDACPTAALIPDGAGQWQLDARLCISYLNIEYRGEIADTLASQMGNNVFGCDICQDVCPWNRRAPVTVDPAFSPGPDLQPLPELANLTDHQFRLMLEESPVWRSKYSGFLRNVAVAMGNAGRAEMLGPLSILATHPNELVSRTAVRALARLRNQLEECFDPRELHSSL